jgi:hypothetical protein
MTETEFVFLYDALMSVERRDFLKALFGNGTVESNLAFREKFGPFYEGLDKPSCVIADVNKPHRVDHQELTARSKPILSSYQFVDG